MPPRQINICQDSIEDDEEIAEVRCTQQLDEAHPSLDSPERALARQNSRRERQLKLEERLNEQEAAL